MRDSFVFYRSFFEAISDLPDETKGRIFCAISDYALNGNLQELSGVERAVFTLIKPQIDANNKKYENGKMGAEHGKKGGRPPKNNPTETPKKPLKNPKQTPNVNVNGNENVNDDGLKGCFDGKVIRLNRRDFYNWVKMTQWDEDYLWKVLDERDEWLYENPTKANNWFISTGNYLKKMSQQ